MWGDYVINDLEKIEYLYKRTGRRKELTAFKLRYKMTAIQRSDEGIDETFIVDRSSKDGLLIAPDITENGVIRRIDRNADVGLQPVPDNINSFINKKFAKQ